MELPEARKHAGMVIVILRSFTLIVKGLRRCYAMSECAPASRHVFSPPRCATAAHEPCACGRAAEPSPAPHAQRGRHIPCQECIGTSAVIVRCCSTRYGVEFLATSSAKSENKRDGELFRQDQEWHSHQGRKVPAARKCQAGEVSSVRLMQARVQAPHRSWSTPVDPGQCGRP